LDYRGRKKQVVNNIKEGIHDRLAHTNIKDRGTTHKPYIIRIQYSINREVEAEQRVVRVGLA
jgi:hypothetical protein